LKSFKNARARLFPDFSVGSGFLGETACQEDYDTGAGLRNE
jgi:hypothetical protein